MKQFFWLLSQGRWLQRPSLILCLASASTLVHDLLADTPLINAPNAIGLYVSLTLWGLVCWLLLRTAEVLHSQHPEAQGRWQRFKQTVVRAYVYVLSAAALLLGVAAVYISVRLLRALSL